MELKAIDGLNETNITENSRAVESMSYLKAYGPRKEAGQALGHIFLNFAARLLVSHRYVSWCLLPWLAYKYYAYSAYDSTIFSKRLKRNTS